MADRIVHVVWAKPRRRIGFGAGLVVFIVAVVLLASWLSAAAPAARSVRHNTPVSAQAKTPQSSAQLSPQQINAKVSSLISRMTVDEKFGQLEMAGPDGPNGTPGDLLTEAKNGQIGSVLDLVGVTNINQVQQQALDSRLGIPLIFGLDVIHGYKTLFPVPLGEASSWDPALVKNDESVSASEATADGIKWTFNPMVDIARDPRWGRVVEGAGEDPFLASAIAAAKVQGYQGKDFSALDKMAATVKHFAAYGAPVAGREYNTVDMSTQQLFNDYLPPYKAAVDAGAATVMASFNSLNGVPNTANPYILQTILRNEWGFGGTVLSDYQAVQELEDFGFANGPSEAARLALTAGINIEMAVQVGSGSPESTYANYGPALLAAGKITMTQLDDAVRHVLTLKYLAGMFTHPLTDPSRVTTAELTPSNLAAARTSADESMVLLNNNNHALPLSTSTPSIAVVGPLADNAANQLGPDVPIGYPNGNEVSQGKVVTVLQGIKNAVASGTTVNYAQGCDITTTTNGVPTPCTSDAGFQAAVDAAKASAVTVVVVGEPAADSGEASSRSQLGLPGKQLQLVQDIAATGKPYAVVLMNGRPLTIDWLAANAPGLLEAWYPGTEGGDAVADNLFGKTDPSGKLPMSFPVNVGQIPITYNELPTGRPYDPNNKYTSKYLDAPNAPLYPFGYGLSYTTFSITGVSNAPTDASSSGHENVNATITNTGSTPGADVVQLYLHENYTSILQPVRKLEGFQRVMLAPGESKTVTFKLGRQNFGFYNDQGQFLVEPGQFDVWVGDSSTGGTHTTFNVS
ncbi:MAG TPA: beta-glucosidase BglX [Mycobacterium sp.]|nr:beta-glucosidase BglX [Mycobacterium sp.]